MSIVSSTYSLDGHTQIDGRRYVRETHTDSDGVAHVIEYLAPVGADYASILAARAVQLAETLAQSEFEGIVQ